MDLQGLPVEYQLFLLDVSVSKSLCTGLAILRKTKGCQDCTIVNRTWIWRFRQKVTNSSSEERRDPRGKEGEGKKREKIVGEGALG